MILRLSQKLTTKIKAGKPVEMTLDSNPYADWSSHLFMVGRAQYIIFMNTPSFYSCLFPGKGLVDVSSFLAQAQESLGGFTADDGQQFIFRKFIAPSFSAIQFARPLNRSATGSMNDHIHGAKYMLESGMNLSEIGFRLNKTPMSALVRADGRKYAIPRDVFGNLPDRITAT